MSILKKIVLSVIPITLISYVFLNFFFYWDISMQVYNTIWVIAAVLVLLYYFIMYRLIWSEDIPRSEKNTHLILVVFIAPYGLYYIWFVFNKKPSPIPLARLRVCLKKRIFKYSKILLVKPCISEKYFLTVLQKVRHAPPLARSCVSCLLTTINE